MIKGIYAAASAMVAGVNKQAIKTHNIANLETPGFKQIFTTLQEFDQTEATPSTLSNSTFVPQSSGMLGLGVMTMETMTKFGKGSIQITNQPLDFAIQGDGFFSHFNI